MEESSTIADIKQLTLGEFYLVGILCYTNIINYMDRVGIASLLVKIQEHFEIGDAYGGLLQTFLLTAFTLSAPFFGYCGDRFSRKWLIMSCMMIWAGFTVGGAFAKHFWILLLSRMMVGVGQSGFTTTAPTIISDVALRGARTVLLSCFFFGIPVGAGLGYFVSVSVAKLTESWRYGLCVGPIFCLIGIGLLFFANFPERGQKEGAKEDAEEIKTTSFIEDLRYLIGVSSFITISGAFTCVCFCMGATAWWTPKCLYFGFQLASDSSTNDLQASAFYFGAITVSTGVIGVLLGLILSRLLRPRFPSSDAIICGLGQMLAAPFVLAALMLIVKSKTLTYVCIFFSMLQINLNWAITTDMLLSIVTPSRRTIAQGVHMLFTHAFGDCISPYIVGSMSDYFRNNFQFTNGSFFIPFTIESPIEPFSLAQNFHSLELSLLSVVFIFMLGGMLYLITARFIVKDMEKAKIKK